MDQVKIGKFIAKRRKVVKLTQSELAEKLNITDRAVSKWETGKSMPDSGIMLDLCKILKINVNELLSGEEIKMEKYSEKAEENLLKLEKEKEEKDRQLLKYEWIIGYFATISFLIMIFLASFLEMPAWLRIFIIVVGSVMFAVGVSSCLKIEQTAGYYECGKCNHKYVPGYMDVFWAPHVGRTRYMRCPECGERSWHKKVISK